ncbi:hypothetical protein BDN72DRAFT_873746 [Pluteus cervinus]|uniref:Uncharacterized protein n=1 Tax=Pluteus cervinus TaxID=181527 RepID=A0ACD3BH58_9AGAR|nr:hypothetical protein BDN72DRAFT_873746 [Pluteus cervinus]
MFTVKATYRGETRKFSFQDINTFPSFSQLCNQLYRVFPISHSYHLSKLLFSPDALKPARILLSKEVRAEVDYQECIAPYSAKAWPNALLRFTVYDETPHKTPSMSSANLSVDTIHFQPSVGESFYPNSSANFGPVISLPAPAPAISHFHIPPPPILYPVPPVPSTPNSPPGLPPPQTGFLAMDVDPPTQSTEKGKAPKACCNVAETKQEIQVLISNLQGYLSRLSTTTFDDAPSTASNLERKSASATSVCSMCITECNGTWYTCEMCHVITCAKCKNRGSVSYCFSTFGPHVFQVRSDKDSTGVSGIHLRPLPDPPTSTSQLRGTEQAGSFSPPEASTTPRPSSGFCPGMRSSSQGPLPAVHRGVYCDMCTKGIVGVRHKCVDCPDYDLCTACFDDSGVEKHNTLHTFINIKEPGRVIVHTVYSGGERDATAHEAPRASPGQTQASLAIHNASCDLCDGRIEGSRYKCANCPDFDTCAACFDITAETHPRHTFVKLTNPSDFIRREHGATPQMHFATCDECNKTIFGVRFKCMHPACPDYDLCDACEALPIALHPDNHPLLKIKSNDALIPTVIRDNKLSVVQPTSTLERTFDSGFIRNPSTGGESPIQSPTPFSPITTPKSVSSLVLDDDHGIPPVQAVEVAQTDPTEVGLEAVYPSQVPVSPLSIGSSRTSIESEESNAELLQTIVLKPPVIRSSSETDNTLNQPSSPLPVAWASSPRNTLRHLLSDVELTPHAPAQTVNQEVVSINPKSEDLSVSAPLQSLLRGRFISDETVLDGQVFPPGAEFMKCWKMENDGKCDWPETTELVFVAGHSLGVTQTVKVGSVKVGASVELWTGELKAPETPGRYVSYWRLRDNDHLFGNSIWIDITVAENTPEADESLASSSVIIMPSATPDMSVTGGGPPSTDRSMPDTASDDGSTISSVSLMSLPASDDDDELRTQAVNGEQDYVVLFDDRSTSSD